MKKKIVGIVVVTLLLVAAALSAVGKTNVGKTQVEEKSTILKEDIVEKQKITEKGNFISILKEILLKRCHLYGSSLLDSAWEPSDAGNNDPIYHLGNVSIGTTASHGKLMIVDGFGNGFHVGISEYDPFVCIYHEIGKGFNVGGRDAFVSIHDEIGNGFNVGGNDTFFEVYAGEGVVARFSGRVRGADAVNNDEFVTKQQVKNSIITQYMPYGAEDENGVLGDISWDENYLYVKTNDGWKRATLETWSSISE